MTGIQRQFSLNLSSKGYLVATNIKHDVVAYKAQVKLSKLNSQPNIELLVRRVEKKGVCVCVCVCVC